MKLKKIKKSFALNWLLRRRAILVCTFFICALGFALPPRVFAEQEIYERWAPVVYQTAASEADYITAVDCDGDWIGNNNWENLDKCDKTAWVYYDARETKTHWFLFYSFFHPRDYTENCPEGCHENDLESIQLTVRKDGSQSGKLEILECIAHSFITIYADKEAAKGGLLTVNGDIILKKGRPAIFIERYGHGIYGHPNGFVGADPQTLPTIRFVYNGKTEKPKGLDDGLVGYGLVPIRDTLWKRRDSVGPDKSFDAIFEYRGVKLPSAISGDTHSANAANTPWAYDQAIGDGIVAGDWFFDPARAALVHAGPMENFSTEYVFNPYLDDLAAAGKQ